MVFGNFSLFKTPFLGWSSVPTSFVSLFVFDIFSYLLLKTLGFFSGCLMSSADIQKLFCGNYSAFKCSLIQEYLLKGLKWVLGRNRHAFDPRITFKKVKMCTRKKSQVCDYAWGLKIRQLPSYRFFFKK